MADYYRKYSDYLRKEFGEKVWKIGLDAGFTCPNNDANGAEGCVFCRNDSFSPRGAAGLTSVSQQLRQSIETIRRERRVTKFIAYLQAGTNTAAPVSLLKTIYQEALDCEGVVGLSIATRPDCLPGEVVELISEFSQKTRVWVELGLQSADNRTLAAIGRGHTFEDYLAAVEKLAQINVRICTHIMIGLPGETPANVRRTARRVAETAVHEIKIHPLLILRQTKLAELYEKGEVRELALEQYAALVCDFLERLPPQMVIQRLTAEAPIDMTIAPKWSMNKLAVLNAVDREFAKRGSRQGAKFIGRRR